ncbi:MAG: cyclic GMP-AMP synthase DncV-like nucleotidyltransferase [Janthinobacterium lividum]
MHLLKVGTGTADSCILTANGAHFVINGRKAMPAVQRNFEDFHTRIRFDEDDHKANLREKRDMLVRALQASLPDDVPDFERFHQGSYSMHTGVIPLGGNYDIDVGLIFDCGPEDYSDPVELKKKVRDALDTHGRTINIRRPCVTVNYMRDGEPEFHVDLALYVKRSDGLLLLAKGKENSAPEHRKWEPAEPKELTELIRKVFADTYELAQYRRCIRYLKRWRDVHFSNGGAPLSIGITVAAKEWFRPVFETSGKPTDLLAMLNWVNALLVRFEPVYTVEDGHYSRLKVAYPLQPFGDLMATLTKSHMTVFEEKLKRLRNALQSAYDEPLPEEGCRLLSKEFGDDFKVPEKSATARVVSAPAISTGSSA